MCCGRTLAGYSPKKGDSNKKCATLQKEIVTQKVVLFIAVLWFVGNTLIFCLRQFGVVSTHFKVPQVFLFSYNIYERLGIVTASIIQLILSSIVIVLTVRSMIKKQRKFQSKAGGE